MYGNYYHPMDREYEGLGLDPKYIGGSTHPGKDQLQELKSKIFLGVQKVELGFMGAGKGNRAQGGIVPGMFSIEEREAMKALAKLNEVTLSTHASVQHAAPSGFDSRSGRFSDETRIQGLKEIERAIDFAKDVAEGGSVTIHLGEFQREISRAPGKFSSFENQKEKEAITYVDQESGSIQQIPKNHKIGRPKINPITGSFIMDDSGNVEIERRDFNDYKKYYLKDKKNISEGDIEKEFIKDFLLDKKEQALGEAERWNSYREEFLKKLGIDKNITKKKFDEKMANLPNEQKSQLKQFTNTAKSYFQQAAQVDDQINNLIPIEKYALEKSADTIAKAALYAYEKEKKNKLKKALFVAPELIFPEVYGGHPQEQKKIIQESRKRMVELLGSDKITTGEFNPDGTPKIIKNTFRDEFIKKTGINIKSKKDAEKIARDHIRGTFDFGHAHTWRKYFDGTDEEFSKWMDGQIKDLIKNDVIGHLHLSDNFGYSDEHVTPGLGSIGKKNWKKWLEMFKEAGIKGGIVEVGGQAAGTEWTAIPHVWGMAGTPLYGGEPDMTWQGAQDSYFGRMNPPPMIFGEFSPSEQFRGKPFYTGLPLE